MIVKWGLAFMIAGLAGLTGLWLLHGLVGFWLTLLLTVVGGGFLMLGLGIGAVVWLIRQADRSFRKVLEVDADSRFDSAAAFEDAMAQPTPGDELEAAAERIRRIRKAAHGLTVGGMDQALEKVASVAADLLAMARRRRDDARRLRPALVHHLAQVEQIALACLRMQDEGRPDAALIGRARQTLGELAEDMNQQRRRTGQADRLDVEARLTLLEQQLQKR